MEKVKNLIAGLGNSLMQDDGIGVYIAENIRTKKEIDIIICGPDVFKIMSAINGHKRIILIDAIEAGLPEGTIICLKESGLLKFDNLSRSSHQISMLEAIKLMKMTLPEFKDIELFFVGVQVGSMSLNQPFTEEVKISADWLLKNIS